jgi:hypothetical protein
VRASELIEVLQELVAAGHDLEVYAHDPDTGETEPARHAEVYERNSFTGYRVIELDTAQ